MLPSFLSGIAIALVSYDVIARLKYQGDMADMLLKLNKTHNALMNSFQAISDQVSHFEMHIGTKPKAR